MFERFTWELRAKLLGTHQTARFTQSSRARSSRPRRPATSDYDSARARTRLRFQPQCAQTVDHLAQNTPKMPISTEVDCTLSTHPTIEGESKETTMHLRSAPLRSTHTQLRTGITARAGNWLVARNEANS